MRAKTYPIKNEILQFSLLARVPVCVDDGEEECKLFLTTNFIVSFTSFYFFPNIYMFQTTRLRLKESFVRYEGIWCSEI
jgi:hypothetical protein